ncbi:hypothetical protein V5F26_05335 [Xanthobacter sp. V4C-8]
MRRHGHEVLAEAAEQSDGEADGEKHGKIRCESRRQQRKHEQDRLGEDEPLAVDEIAERGQQQHSEGIAGLAHRRDEARRFRSDAECLAYQRNHRLDVIDIGDADAGSDRQKPDQSRRDRLPSFVFMGGM